RPQTSPVTASVDDEGRIVLSTRETARKVKNLERRPDAALCGLSDDFFGPWVHVDGQVEIVHLPEAMDLLVDYYRSVRGEHPDWDDYRAAMQADRRVILRMTVERAGPRASG
ncbi:MAG TPA: TIGR03618 family F420-dependent PPOX class oxidoreductase, partial [Acidimicrobiales bacterium]|nr:TIGR03618 family F420-dependent PPOX class oxidoreductase [Acidimicrobiales bacterium]